MTALQSATKSLLTQLQSAATNNGDVYVSIVPFVKDVNLGAANYNSDYIYWGTLAQDPTLSDNNSWDANNGTCSIGSYSPRSSCVAHSSCSISGDNSQSSCTSDGTCSISGNNSQSSCTSAGICSISGSATTPRAPARPEPARYRVTRPRAPARQRAPARYRATRPRAAAPVRASVRNRSTRRAATCSQHNGTWTAGTLDGRQLDRRRNVDGRRVDSRGLDPGDMDAQQPQHLERLRHGSRQFDRARHRRQLRHQRRCAEHAAIDHVDVVSGRAIQRLPARR